MFTDLDLDVCTLVLLQATNLLWQNYKCADGFMFPMKRQNKQTGSI